MFPRYDIYLVTVIIKGLRWIQLIVCWGKGTSLTEVLDDKSVFHTCINKIAKIKNCGFQSFLGHDIICKSHKYITLITKSQFRMKYEENLAVC